MNVYGLILAGGVGNRCGGDIPKQYIEIDGKPVFIYTAEEMRRSGIINGICIVCSEAWLGYVLEKCKGYSINLVCTGNAGETGIESIWNGVDALVKYGAQNEDICVIQDANRPFLDSSDILSGVDLCIKNGCAIGTNVQVCDQVHVSGKAKKLVQRDGLRELMRPEFHTFKNLKYCKALYDTKKFISQNPACMLLENGEDIEIFESRSLPVKITYSTDLEVFKAVLHWRNLKILN